MAALKLEWNGGVFLGCHWPRIAFPATGPVPESVSDSVAETVTATGPYDAGRSGSALPVRFRLHIPAGHPRHYGEGLGGGELTPRLLGDLEVDELLPHGEEAALE